MSPKIVHCLYYLLMWYPHLAPSDIRLRSDEAEKEGRDFFRSQRGAEDEAPEDEAPEAEAPADEEAGGPEGREVAVCGVGRLGGTNGDTEGGWKCRFRTGAFGWVNTTLSSAD